MTAFPSLVYVAGSYAATTQSTTKLQFTAALGLQEVSRNMDFFELENRKVIQEIQTSYAGIWELALDTNSYLVEFQTTLTANNMILNQVVGVSLYIRCMSSYQALMLLVSKGMLPQSQVMLRSLVEALFILVAISKDKEFAKLYVGHEEHQRKGVLNKMRRYKESVDVADPNIELAKDKIEEIKENIENNQIKSLSTEQISKIAGLHSWYDTVYALTSTAVHVSARSIQSHVVVDSERKITSFKNEPEIELIDLPLGCGINSMHIAVDAICDIMGVEHRAENIALNKRYEEYVKKKA